MKNLLLVVVVVFSLSSCSIFKGKQKDNYKVRLETTEGNMTLLLYKDVPQHSANFIKLVKEGFYDSLLFHRVIPSFMIQGGDPDSKTAGAGKALGNGSVGYRVPAEFKIEKYIHKKGALAAARDGNPEKASSGCQFYIVEGKTYNESELNNLEKQKGIKYTEEQRKLYMTIGGTPHLDNEYTVYGEVIDGLDIITNIASVMKDGNNRPYKDVRIIRASIIR
jgi:cyclophilin family peptidyl-prolyl cis-trans isomerase